jgi:thiol-disulfide isomerase/thioredoxin
VSLPEPVPKRPLHALGQVALGVAIVCLCALAARALRSRVEARPSVVISPAPTPSPSPSPGDLSSLAKRGKLLYQVQCVRCHGLEGHGDGPDSAELRPPPRDFASDRWRFSPNPEAIRKVIVEGIPGTAMYPMGGTFSPRELDALVDHIRSLARRPESNLKSAGFIPGVSSGRAPGFEVEDLEGGRRLLEFGRSGKLTLLVFWGTSCAPCQEELPELDQLAEEFRDRGLEVVPICVDESDRARVARILRGKFDRFPSFISTDAMARIRYDIQTLPVAVLIDRQGNLLGISRGGVDWKGSAARRLVEELLPGT